MLAMEPTLNRLEHDLVVRLKAVIESEVEKIAYRADGMQFTMSCFLFMKNGMVIEGVTLLMPGGGVEYARNAARRKALESLRLIQQYILADDLYVEAGLGCGETQFKNQLKGKS